MPTDDDGLLEIGTIIQHVRSTDMTGAVAARTVDRSTTPPRAQYLITWDNEWYDTGDIVEMP